MSKINHFRSGASGCHSQGRKSDPKGTNLTKEKICPKEGRGNLFLEGSRSPLWTGPRESLELDPTFPSPLGGPVHTGPASSQPGCDPPGGRAVINNNVLQPGEAGTKRILRALRRNFWKRGTKGPQKMAIFWNFWVISPQTFGQKCPTRLDLGSFGCFRVAFGSAQQPGRPPRTPPPPGGTYPSQHLLPGRTPQGP